MERVLQPVSAPARERTMADRKGPADYEAMAKRRNAKWLGPAVANANSRTWWKCLVCGRNWRAIYNSLQRGTGCPGCGILRRNAANRTKPAEYHALAAALGLRWTGAYPASANHPTEWACGQGHRWMSAFARMKQRSGCARCAAAAHRERCARERHGPDAYRAIGETVGLDWLGPAVAAAHVKTGWRCRACDRPWRASYHKVSQGRACPRCTLNCRNERLRVPAERYAAIARERGIEWLGPRPARNSHPTRWRCPRGHEWETSYTSVTLGSSCHVCQGRVNGLLVSQVQRRLAEHLGGELNHRVGRRCIDVALECAGVHIAVEFDSWYFHGHPDRQVQDEARERELVRLGWRVLRIRSAYRLPAPEELDAAIEQLVAGAERAVITLPEWGVGPYAGAAFDPERKPRPYRRRDGGHHA